MENIIQYEKYVLSALKMNNELYDEHRITDSLFSLSLHKNIFKCIKQLIDQGQEANTITIFDYSKKNKLGIPASELSNLNMPTEGNVKYYIDELKEYNKLRLLRRLAAGITDKINQKEIEECIEYVEQKITEITNESENKMSLIKDIVSEVIDEIEKNVKTPGEAKGIKTGYPSIDKLLNGIKPELIIIGARASIGKTAIMLNMVKNIAQKGIKVGVFELEMSKQSIVKRLIAIKSKVNSSALDSGYLKRSDIDGIMVASNELYQQYIVIDDNPDMTLQHLRANSRAMVRRGVQIIFIDYLTLITVPGSKLPRHEQVAQISRTLKSLSRELNVPVIALTQVTRSAEGKRPSLADIRESGSIEQDADIVIFLHRDRASCETEFIIAKNRNGPTDIVKLNFFKTQQRFEELEQNDNYDLNKFCKG